MQKIKSVLFLFILWTESLFWFVIMLPVLFMGRKQAYIMPVLWTKRQARCTVRF